MEFSWNAEKARRNLAKHGISFEAARQVFADPHVVIVEDCEDEHGEIRYHAIGYADPHRLVVVVFLERPEDDTEIIHVISARKAEDYEEKTYARQFTQGD
jgi:uncharacterized DUF497 family protein